MHSAADNVTPLTLELGGKSPYLVFEDADLEEAVQAAASGIFYNSGQSCDASSRILLHENIHDEFVDQFVEHTAEVWKPGDNLKSGTTMGPLAFEDQYNKTKKYVDIGTSEGAELVYGGSGVFSDQFEDGWYFEPTIFDKVESDMTIAQEEIFGPVQSIMTFSDYDEAVELANDVEYGLAAGVSTQDLSLAHKVAADIEAGSVWINEYRGNSPGVPFGGYKNSGFGRECAQETISDYQHTKAVTIGLN
jgi:aldehyde dehydrogenase (NAD+)